MTVASLIERAKAVHDKVNDVAGVGRPAISATAPATDRAPIPQPADAAHAGPDGGWPQVSAPPC